MLAGPNHICTVSLVLQSWTWSALLCKIHTKPPGPVGRWPEGKIGYKLKDLSTAGFWKGKKQEEPSQNSLILVPCWTPPWQKVLKKELGRKTWKWCNLAPSVDYRLLPLSPWRTAEWFARYHAKTTVQQRAIPRDCFCWVAGFPFFSFLKCWLYEVCNAGSCQIMETVCFCHYRCTVPLWPGVKQLWAQAKNFNLQTKIWKLFVIPTSFQVAPWPGFPCLSSVLSHPFDLSPAPQETGSSSQ